ncbi:MAG: hypothetical protein NVSMB49_02370 [Ktedonobacteraceae bacterium]
MYVHEYTRYAQKVMIDMVTKVTQGNALQEATQIAKRYEEMYSADVQHWVCEVCGMLYTGSIPTSCDDCGVADAFTVQQEMRNEIGRRW